MKNKILLLVLFIANISLAFAQSNTVRGKVTDENGAPLVGVSVLIKGSNTGTSTDANGYYSIPTANSKTLQFSFIGYQSKEVVVTGKTINIDLNRIDKVLGDVIVVAYGTASKAGYTGAVSTINQKQIGNSEVSSVSRVLQGAVPGVQSIASSGQPGSDANIYIRGIGSVNASSSPLYIVDGAPYDGSLNSINSADIESISVLKDAASTALYGSRAGNGLIIITTKQGAKNKRAKIEARFTYGVSSRAVSDYQEVGVNDYFKLYWEALRNQQLYVNGASAASAADYASKNIVSLLGVNPYGSKYSQPVGLDGNIVSGASPLWSDNWSNIYTQRAHRSDSQVSISGGGNNSTYYISLGYLKDQGIALASDFKRYTGRVNLNADLRDWLRVSTSISLIHSVQNAPMGEDSNTENTLNFARLIPSIYPVWERDQDTGQYLLDKNGKRVVDYGWYRPSAAMAGLNYVGSSVYDFDKVTNDVASIRASAEVDLLRGLTYKGSINVDYTNGNNHDYRNPIYGEYSEQDYPGEVDKSNALTTGFTANNILTYKTTLNNIHNLKLLAGQEYYEYNTSNIAGSRTGFPVIGLDEPDAASQLNSFSGSSDQYKLSSYFGNVDYDYNHRYYGSASIRRDGSSRFSPDARWGTFWSVGASWRISEEDFIKNIEAISKLSLRASYGGQGNDQIGSYNAYQNLYNIQNNLGESGFVKTSLGNPNLVWETNLNLNVAVDYGFFDNRLYGSIEYFNRRSKNLLFTAPEALSTGYSGYTANAGALKNVGFEFSVTGTPVKTKDWQWDISVNATHYKNEITQLPQQQIVSTYNIRKVGGSIYDFFLVQWAGVDPADGLPQWYKTDANGNRVKTKSYNEANTTASRIKVGSSLPKLTGGYSSNLKYKDFELSALFAYSLGGKIYNADKLSILNIGTNAGRSMSVEMLDRWTPENPNTDVPRLQTSTANSWTNTSTRFLVDADYLRLKNITLGYSIPKSFLIKNKIDIDNLKVFVQAENLFTVFGEKGMDPEQTVSGVSYYYYPAMKTLSFGVNLSF